MVEIFHAGCSKMATGSGKTIVMGMLIAWQVLNKVANGKDTRFSKNILVVAPGLMESLRQGKVKIINWHALAWDSEERLTKKKTVDKRGAKSDEAYVRETLGDMANATNLIVINDEAHHAWRIPAESKIKGVKKEDYRRKHRLDRRPGQDSPVAVSYCVSRSLAVVCGELLTM